MADEQDVVIQDEDKVELERRIRKELDAEYSARLEVQINSISAKLQQENKKVVEEALERYRQEMQPPTEEDVQKLLTQEYVSFTFEVKMPTKNGTPHSKTFVIQELPQKIEKKIGKRIKDILLPFSQDLGALSVKLLEGDVANKVLSIMNTFEPALEAMTSIATVCLNPFGEEEEVTEAWVGEHLSSVRIMRVVMAQIEVNHMRDFFSLLFRGTKLLK